MINIARTTSIALPAADVFTFVADVRNEPQWHTDLLEASPMKDGPVGEGRPSQSGSGHSWACPRGR